MGAVQSRSRISSLKKFIKRDIDDDKPYASILRRVHNNYLASVAIEIEDAEAATVQIYICSISVIIPNETCVKMITKRKCGYDVDNLTEETCKKIVKKILKL